MTEHERLTERIRSAMCGGCTTPSEIAERLIEDGDVIVLPCKVGDMVYWIVNDTGACHECKHFSSFYGMDEMCDKDGDRVIMNPWISDHPLCEKQFFKIIEHQPDIDWIFGHRNDFGKTVFLSREEAEAVLAERRINK